MRIAYVTETYPPEINGVALTVARTAAYLRRVGHAVDLIRPAQQAERRGPGSDEWLSWGGPIPMYRDLRWGAASPAQLARRFAQTGAELVHVATEGPLGAAAVLAAGRLGLPVTSDFRTNFHQYSRYYRLGLLEPAIARYLRWFHNRTSRTFVPTRQTRVDLERAGFERLQVIGRGVDLRRFAPSRRDRGLRERWGSGEGPVLLSVGRLASEKNVELALAAWRQAQTAAPGARMVVVGDGPKRARLQQQFPDAIFVGVQTGDALAAHYASADLFLFPSESETFGNVTLEALASGLPVVAFDLAAAGEYVIDGVGGRLVAPGDAAAYVAAVRSTCASASTLADLRDGARRSVEHLEWDTVLHGFDAQLHQAAYAKQPSRFDVSAA